MVYRLNFMLGFLVAVIVLSPPSSLEAAPKIQRIEFDSGTTVALTGQGFGRFCKDCEVVVDYGENLRFAVPVKSWSERRVMAHIPDLNRALNVEVKVVTPQGLSNAVKHRIKRAIVPNRDYRKAVPTQFKNLLMFERSHRLKVGDKGEDRFDVSNQPLACGIQGLSFDHARIVYGKRRFGEAQIISYPSPGCIQCAPVIVRWYHEPTGYLTYQVHVYHRQVEGICSAQRR